MKTIRDILHGGCGCALALLAAAHSAQSAIIRVHPDPPGSGAWALSVTTIEAALAAADPEDEIWIYQGTYVPGAPTTTRASTFELPRFNGSYTLAGNFNGTEEFITERDHINPAHATILSGLFGQDPGNPEDRVFHVVWGEKGSQQNEVTYRLDALQVEYGWATGRDGDPHSRDDFTHAAAAGGGAYLKDVCAIMTLCTFRNNRAGSVGEYCAIRPGAGAAVYHDIGSPALTLESGSALDIFSSAFEENEAWFDAWGGAIYSDSAGYVLLAVNTVFYANRAIGGSCTLGEVTTAWDAHGGAIAGSSASTDLVLVNCTLVDNAAEIETEADNEPIARGGAIRVCCDDLSIRNSILVGNLQAGIVAHIANTCPPGDPSTTVAWSNVEGGWSGTGNIDADPLFVNRSIGNLRLQACSPSIDAGDEGLMVADLHDVNRNDDLEEPAPDRDLLARVAASLLCTSGTVDQGAFERPFLPADFDCNSAVDFQDLLILLAAYGACPGSPDPCPWDLDESGTVGFPDLLILLSWWTSDSPSCPHVTLGSIWDCINEIGLAPENLPRLEACIEAMIINGTP